MIEILDAAAAADKEIQQREILYLYLVRVADLYLSILLLDSSCCLGGGGGFVLFWNIYIV